MNNLEINCGVINGFHFKTNIGYIHQLTLDIIDKTLISENFEIMQKIEDTAYEISQEINPELNRKLLEEFHKRKVECVFSIDDEDIEITLNARIDSTNKYERFIYHKIKPLEHSKLVEKPEFLKSTKVLMLDEFPCQFLFLFVQNQHQT